MRVNGRGSLKFETCIASKRVH